MAGVQATGFRRPFRRPVSVSVFIMIIITHVYAQREMETDYTAFVRCILRYGIKVYK